MEEAPSFLELAAVVVVVVPARSSARAVERDGPLVGRAPDGGETRADWSWRAARARFCERCENEGLR